MTKAAIKTVKPSGEMILKQKDGYDIFLKNDGYDYEKIWRDFERGDLPAHDFSLLNKEHRVALVKYEGRSFVVKHDWEVPRHFENKLWRVLRGPFYSNQMKQIRRAIERGCKVVPDIYLTAEKRGGFIRKESFVVMEYIAGTNLGSIGDENFPLHHKAMLTALGELHRYGMALGDCNPSNFIITDAGMKLIDLSWVGFACTGKAKDALTVKKWYGMDLPLQGPLERMAFAYIVLKGRIQKFMRGFKQRLKRK